MPVFRYKAIDPGGLVQEGELEAASEEAAIAHLKQGGQLPVSAQEVVARKRANGRRLFSGGRSISRAQLTVITRELARLIGAGVPLEKSLTILISVSDVEVERKLLIRLVEEIRGGASFADAIEAQGNVFSRLYVSMVRAGEAGGALQIVLDRLADYLERSGEFRAEVSAAMIYPAILLTVSLLSLVLLLTFVVPQFQRMFDDAGATLPLPTQIVIGLADWMQNYWWTLLVGLLILLLTVPRLMSRPGVRLWWDGVLLSTAGIGTLVRKIEVARFSRTLSTLLSNGVVLLTALSIVKETLSNQVLGNSIKTVSEGLKVGKTLSSPMLEAGLFPKLACHMVRVGEETGRLDEMLMDVADIYDKEVQQSLKKMLGLLEPLMILTLGILIAGIIFSILLALLSINDLAF
ncbi:MAG: type II secretion system F family protein [Gammaproteobacteria bacterium]|nr:type II secretion system F family protein [Gammaproteobacteria bacterium]